MSLLVPLSRTRPWFGRNRERQTPMAQDRYRCQACSRDICPLGGCTAKPIPSMHAMSERTCRENEAKRRPQGRMEGGTWTVRCSDEGHEVPLPKQPPLPLCC